MLPLLVSYLRLYISKPLSTRGLYINIQFFLDPAPHSSFEPAFLWLCARHVQDSPTAYLAQFNESIYIYLFYFPIFSNFNRVNAYIFLVQVDSNGYYILGNSHLDGSSIPLVQQTYYVRIIHCTSQNYLWWWCPSATSCKKNHISTKPSCKPKMKGKLLEGERGTFENKMIEDIYQLNKCMKYESLCINRCGLDIHFCQCPDKKEGQSCTYWTYISQNVFVHGW